MSTLDRTATGVTRECCKCSRPFKGEGWMDYCAECHAEQERTSPLNRRWACLNCGWKGTAGKMFTGKLASDPLECPKCRSGNTSPAEGIRDLPEYHGEIPELKQ